MNVRSLCFRQVTEGFLEKTWNSDEVFKINFMKIIKHLCTSMCLFIQSCEPSTSVCMYEWMKYVWSDGKNVLVFRYRQNRDFISAILCYIYIVHLHYFLLVFSTTGLLTWLLSRCNMDMERKKQSVHVKSCQP